MSNNKWNYGKIWMRNEETKVNNRGEILCVLLIYQILPGMK